MNDKMNLLRDLTGMLESVVDEAGRISPESLMALALQKDFSGMIKGAFGDQGTPDTLISTYTCPICKTTQVLEVPVKK